MTREQLTLSGTDAYDKERSVISRDVEFGWWPHSKFVIFLSAVPPNYLRSIIIAYVAAATHHSLLSEEPIGLSLYCIIVEAGIDGLDRRTLSS
ncbi:hypothetical protein B296_00002267 [Ensete ventricosum]|uniref:Uncharacterized protein n=1 Tax=Ensete ventricosum TaxID=4639 RepID=A0A427AK68_ENSVE|nr:hypothetical protein B296_00002267 [Ensete ventricosum]